MPDALGGLRRAKSADAGPSKAAEPVKRQPGLPRRKWALGALTVAVAGVGLFCLLQSDLALVSPSAALFRVHAFFMKARMHAARGRIAGYLNPQQLPAVGCMGEASACLSMARRVTASEPSALERVVIRAPNGGVT